MPVSLETIHKHLEDFFVHTFETAPESSVFFRFRQFPSVIAESDYVDPEHPENTSIALEKFSDLANRLPAEGTEGLKVYFGVDLIDSKYNTLLTTSIPAASPNEPNGQAIISAFNATRNAASLDWDVYSYARQGVADRFRPAFPSPSQWYDLNNAEIWTPHSFEVSESVSWPANEVPNFIKWTLALDGVQLLHILPSLGSAGTPGSLITDLINNKPEYTLLFNTAATDTWHHHGGGHGPAPPDTIIHDHDEELPDPVDPEPVDEDELLLDEVPRFKKRLNALDIRPRTVVLDYVRENARTQDASTSRLKISFEYCTVNIRRPWFADAFIRNESWFIPGTAKGSKSAPGPQMNLSLLPVEMIAIKNLSIEADWSQVDVDTSRGATNFGPFEIKTEIVNGRMSHEGIQIIGYMLQRMPALPPNDPPQH